MIFSQWTRALVFLVPLLSVIHGNLDVWHIYVVQVIIGLVTPLYVPASQAITPTIVVKEQLGTANAYLDGTTRLMMFLAPMVGGVVINYIGTDSTLLLVFILLAISGFLLLRMDEQRVPQDTRKTWLELFKEGIHYFFKERTIVWLGVFLAFVQFGVGVTMVINLPYITDVLKGNYEDYGLFMAGFPLGYVIGSMFIGKLKFRSRRMFMLGSLVISGFTYISLGIINTIVLAIIVEIIAGIMMAFFSIHNITICQRAIPNHLMGKVMSVRLVISRTAMPIGILFGGIVSELWGIRPLYIMIGLTISLVSTIGIIFPYFKFIDGTSQPGFSPKKG